METTGTEAKAVDHVFGETTEEDLTLEHLGYQPGMGIEPFMAV